MINLVIGLLLGFLLALVLDDLLEEYRGTKKRQATARRARAYVHAKQTRKRKTRKA